MNRVRLEAFVLALLIHAATLASPLPTRTIATLSVEEGGIAASLTQLIRSQWMLGFTARSLDEAQWGWVTAGAILRVAPGLVLEGQADLGRGEDDGRDFDYRVLRAALSREIVPQKLWIEVEDRWIDVDRESGNLVRAGALWFPRPDLSTSASAIVGTGGDLDAEYLTGRADWTREPWTFILGGTAGRSEPALFDDPGAAPAPVDVREVFAGVRRPARRGTVDAFVGLLRVGDEDRLRATVVWSF